MAIQPSLQNMVKDAAAGIVRRAVPKPPPRPRREPKGLKHSRGAEIPKDIRRAVHERSQQCCERCGVWCAAPVGEIHHRRNKSQGLDNRLSNLCHLCRECHNWIGRCPNAAHEAGFHLEHGQDPGEVEVLYAGPYAEQRGCRRVLLTDDGGIEPIGGAA